MLRGWIYHQQRGTLFQAILLDDPACQTRGVLTKHVVSLSIAKKGRAPRVPVKAIHHTSRPPLAISAGIYPMHLLIGNIVIASSLASQRPSSLCSQTTQILRACYAPVSLEHIRRQSKDLPLVARRVGAITNGMVVQPSASKSETQQCIMGNGRVRVSGFT